MASSVHTGDSAGIDRTGSKLHTQITERSGPRGLPQLIVTGSVDIATANQFAEAVARAASDRKVLLDLVGADFVGTAGIAVLFECRPSFAAVLVSADSIVDRALSVAGFPTIPTHRVRRPPFAFRSVAALE